MIRNVYVVMECIPYEYDAILAVFSSRRKAVEYVERLRSHRKTKSSQDEIDFEVYGLNQEPITR